MKHTRRALFSMVAAAFASKKLPTPVRPKLDSCYMSSFYYKAHPYVSYDLVNDAKWTYRVVDVGSEIVG
jgi:hypothetical protein